jgi:monothiol glutaredoxin
MALTDTVRADLEKRVHASDVVLFMKGNRRFPQCGFSATVVGILEQLAVKYETFNVLEDGALREGMKEFSSWPTFPQLYFKGEFVGGCDIVKAMHASGDLQKKLGVVEAPATPPRVTISAAAANALKAALADVGDEVLRLEIDGGFNPDLSVGPKVDGDLEVSSSGVLLFVARGSASRAEGVSIDYVAGPGGMAFKIDNPNEPARVKPIGPAALKAMLDAGSVTLFDVRPAAERAVASIAQATPLDTEGRRILAELDRRAPIALHCHHGMRSRAAGEELLRDGFANVYNLEGGIEAWSRDVDAAVPRY